MADYPKVGGSGASQGPGRAQKSDQVAKTKHSQAALAAQPPVAKADKNNPAHVIVQGQSVPALDAPKALTVTQVADGLEATKNKLNTTPQTREDVEELSNRLNKKRDDTATFLSGKKSIHARLGMLKSAFREIQSKMQVVAQERQADLEKVADEKRAQADKKTQEIQEKQKEAKDSALLGKIFGWIAVAVSVIVAAVSVAIAVCTAGAGTPLVVGACMAVAAAITAVTAQVLTETGAMSQIAAAAASAFADANASKKDIEKAKRDWEMALGIGFTVVTIVLSLGSAGALGAAGKAAASGADVALKVSNFSLKAMNTARFAAVGVESGTTVAKAGADIYAGVKTKEAAYAEADKIKLEGQMESLRTYMEQVFANIKKSIERLNQSIKQESQDQQEKTQTLSAVISKMSI